jgi:hypothetical protein
VLEQAEAKLAKELHPDPYRREYNLSGRHPVLLLVAGARLMLNSAPLPGRHEVVSCTDKISRMKSTLCSGLLLTLIPIS